MIPSKCSGLKLAPALAGIAASTREMHREVVIAIAAPWLNDLEIDPSPRADLGCDARAWIDL